MTLVIQRKLLPVNFTKGRRGGKPEAIVLHISEGTLDSMTGWFRNPDAKVSAHYGVARDGRIVQYVDDADTAWHAGVVKSPTAPLVRAKGNSPNLWSIGVEHEGYAHSEPPPEQMEASARLLAHLSKRHGIPLDPIHVIYHREIRADKTCPGKLDRDELLRMAKGASQRSDPQPGDRVWSDYLGEHLIVTRYESDDEWYFLRESTLRVLGTKAGAPFSAMKPERAR